MELQAHGARPLLAANCDNLRQSCAKLIALLARCLRPLDSTEYSRWLQRPPAWLHWLSWLKNPLGLLIARFELIALDCMVLSLIEA
jgi:hypothetical protein